MSVVDQENNGESENVLVYPAYGEPFYHPRSKIIGDGRAKLNHEVVDGDCAPKNEPLTEHMEAIELTKSLPHNREPLTKCIDQGLEVPLLGGSKTIDHETVFPQESSDDKPLQTVASSDEDDFSWALEVDDDPHTPTLSRKEVPNMDSKIDNQCKNPSKEISVLNHCGICGDVLVSTSLAVSWKCSSCRVCIHRLCMVDTGTAGAPGALSAVGN